MEIITNLTGPILAKSIPTKLIFRKNDSKKVRQRIETAINSLLHKPKNFLCNLLSIKNNLALETYLRLEEKKSRYTVRRDLF